jgi:pimeloyl-ACP methyl ester carboxylesterase
MTTLHVERGGAGASLLVLLHGLGANASVWKPLLGELAPLWPGRWIAPDLRGHGRSPFEGPYGFATHAADVAELVAAETDGPVLVVGHSFGGVVGALLGSGLFGIEVTRLFAFGVKLEWAAAEIAGSQAMAKKAPRVYPDRADAVASFLKGAGLIGLVSADDEDAIRSVTEAEGGYRVRFDPRVFGGAGPAIAPLFGLARCPFRLAAGDADPMVSLAQMQPLDPDAFLFPKAGHNPHVEQPSAVAKAVAEMCK